MKERIPSLDVLRFLGLFAIFMAHTLTNDWELQIVSFDVVLLVLVSGVTASIGNSTSQIGRTYFIKRCVRLLIPAWIFLTIYFIIGTLLHRNYSLFKIVTFYSLFTDWYVWIIRVFLIIALFFTLLNRFNEAVKKNNLFLIIITIAFVLFDVCTVHLQTTFSYFDARVLVRYVIYMLCVCIPYLFVYLVGLRLRQLEKKHVLLYSIFLFVGFVGIAMYLYYNENAFIRTDVYKYPPKMYYICFSLGVSLILWLLKDTLTNVIYKSKALATIVSFIGQNTIWIYFWHVLFIEFVPGIELLNEWLRFLLILISSVSCYYCQYVLVTKVILPRIDNVNTKNNLKRIMCG